MAVRDCPLLTEVYSQVSSFLPDPGSAYLFGTSGEERSAHSAEWQANISDVNFLRITDEENATIQVHFQSDSLQIALRGRRSLAGLWARIGRPSIYLDITGLSHHVWAPLLRSGLESGSDIKVVYVEPEDYRFSPVPTEGEIFDLSEKISGIAPIPGFASLTEPQDDHSCFVPLLGFEGARFAYVLEQVQPPGGKIVPIIGVPGFRPEYPFYAYQGNRAVLQESRAWKNVQFALANCPFSLLYKLQEIAKEYPRDRLQIAPIGTKPHALGAVLFALSSRDPVELVYDHPIRKGSRTKGTDKLLVYHLTAFSRGPTQ